MNNQMNKIQFNKSYLEDDFVGIKYEKNNISICLPLGYDLSLFDSMSDKE